MRRLIALAVLGGALCGALAGAGAAWEDPWFYVWFAPGFNASERACSTLKFASRGTPVRLVVPVLDSGALCDALLRAHEHGADVKVLIPGSGLHARGSLVAVLGRAGVPVLVDHQHTGPAPRFLIVGTARVFSGAFGHDTPGAGWGDATDIQCEDYARKYILEWDRHEAHAEPWPERKDP